MTDHSPDVRPSDVGGADVGGGHGATRPLATDALVPDAVLAGGVWPSSRTLIRLRWVRAFASSEPVVSSLRIGEPPADGADAARRAA